MQNSLTYKQQNILDVFRIIATLFVVVGHSLSFYQFTIFKDQNYFPYIQNIGVVMLFILSGFLTTYSINSKNCNKEYTFILYVKHKLVRIYKEYIPGLGFIALTDFLSIKINKVGYSYYESYNLKQFLGNIFMMQGTIVNYIPGIKIIPFGSGRPLWTMAIEWWFYMTFGVFFLTIANNEKINLRKAFLLALISVVSLDYFIGGRGGGLGFVFGLGVLVYYVFDLVKKNNAYLIFLTFLVLYIIYGAIFRDAYTIYSFIILSIIFGACLNLGGKDTAIRRNRIAEFISQSTFMLYLIHYSIIYMIYISNIEIDAIYKFVIGIIFSIIFSVIMHFIFGKKGILFIRRKT